MSDRDVTAVVTTTGSGRGLTSATDSVLSQHGADVHLVVVLDGVETNAEDRRTLVQLETKHTVVRVNRVGSPAVARNIGLGLARSRWIAFLDDDDTWEPDKLRQQLDATGGKQRPVLVGSNAWRIIDGQPQGLYLADVPATVGLADLLATNWIITSSALADTAMLNYVGGFPGDPSYRAIEDYCTWLKLAVVGNVRVLFEPLVRYSVGGAGSLSAMDPLSGEEARRRAVEHVKLATRVWTNWRTMRARRTVEASL